MNKANLKSYAPKARLDFIKAVTERANVLGISAAGVVPAEVRGDVALIDGREWPAKVASQRDELIARIKRHGFEQTMDEVAYTWFNRFAALRYMEIHDYLGHGWRVLSSRDGGLPEILRHASEVTLPGLNPDRAREMQLAGNQDNELYKLLLVAQCNELSRVMPFLFERIDDESELLLPENLLRTDSIVSKLVDSVPEHDWHDIEVVGWLYQFYISQKKEQVIGNVLRSEDIPAATQLFTPNWIVQYLVQNSLGRLWINANPSSSLASQWPYYVHPAAQKAQVQSQLDVLFQSRVLEDGGALNPETITFLDPACGSGHILVVAYDVLKAIYLERGYQLRAIPRLILERNLYGLDIDDRAAQLAGFALLMKARADDRRLFNDPPRLNVLSLQESQGLALRESVALLAPYGVDRLQIEALDDTFSDSKTFGSLTELPEALSEHLSDLSGRIQSAQKNGDLYSRQAAIDVSRLLDQARILGMRFDVVAANPPYMGRKAMPARLQALVDARFPISRADLYACFIERAGQSLKSSGIGAIVSMDSWMYGDDYNELREEFLEDRLLYSLAHLGPHAFPEIPGEVVQVAAICFSRHLVPGYVSSFHDLRALKTSEDKAIGLAAGQSRFDVSAVLFGELPRRVFAYYASESTLQAFKNSRPLIEFAEALTGLQTGDNPRFLRFWFEVPFDEICFSASADDKSKLDKWFPYVKGSDFRKWYGNQIYVINWAGGGEEIRAHPSATIRNSHRYFQEGIAYNNLSKKFCARDVGRGFIFDQKNSMLFPARPEYKLGVLGYLHSSVITPFLDVVAPKGFGPGSLKIIPAKEESLLSESVASIVRRLVSISKTDWDDFEVSWDFQRSPLVSLAEVNSSIVATFNAYAAIKIDLIQEAMQLENLNDEHFGRAFKLRDFAAVPVSEDQITLTQPHREKDSQRLVSYVLGCLMGRYSLDEPGLVYAGKGGIGFDRARADRSFPVDSDGIVPVTDEPWFEDDGAARIRDFVRVVWGTRSLEENLAWLADSLGTKASETPDEAIRRYLADKFYRDHLQTYKRRPIYWLFSSGKQGAFQALVYLHRYNEGTLGRLRAEYVVPLVGKMVSRVEMLDKEVAAASSPAARTKLQKQVDSLRKKQVELLTFDEKLRHYADMRITLNLDDGVKVNYAKFGDLVAESKAITGGSDE